MLNLNQTKHPEFLILSRQHKISTMKTIQSLLCVVFAALVPDQVKKELLQRIRTFIAQQSNQPGGDYK